MSFKYVPSLTRRKLTSPLPPTLTQFVRSQARKILPAAAFVLKSQREATDIALELNATVDMFSGATARWAAANLLKERGEVVLSPADRVRNLTDAPAYRREKRELNKAHPLSFNSFVFLTCGDGRYYSQNKWARGGFVGPSL